MYVRRWPSLGYETVLGGTAFRNRVVFVLGLTPGAWALSARVITFLSLESSCFTHEHSSGERKPASLRPSHMLRVSRRGSDALREIRHGHGREGSQEATYGFTAFANHPASCRRGNSDVGLQLHLFFGIKEVFFFQFPKDPSLSLQTRPIPERKLVTGLAAVHTGDQAGSCPHHFANARRELGAQ